MGQEQKNLQRDYVEALGDYHRWPGTDEAYLDEVASRLSAVDGETLLLHEIRGRLTHESNRTMSAACAAGIVTRSRRLALSPRRFSMGDLQGAYASIINARTCSDAKQIHEEPAYLLRVAAHALDWGDDDHARSLVADALMLIVSESK